MKTNVVIFGPPFSGKGTQATTLVRQHGFCQVCSGDILREHVRRHTELGMKAKKYMDDGKLVPDDLVIEAITWTLKSDGEVDTVFDGFPRNIRQAQLLDMSIPISLAIVLEVSEKELLHRARTRISCPKCGRPYGKGQEPKREGQCDDCGVNLIRRDDDSQDEVNRKRIRTYQEETAPLIGYYQQGGRLHRIDGARNSDQVLAEILEILGTE